MTRLLILVNELKGIIVTRGETQASVARKLGITETTMTRKLQKGVFDSDEIYEMIKFLKIENPEEIFFAEEVN